MLNSALIRNYESYCILNYFNLGKVLWLYFYTKIGISWGGIKMLIDIKCRFMNLYTTLH
jgi:hypothetical protein